MRPGSYGGPHGAGPEYGGGVALLAQRPQLILSPGVAHVVAPRMLHHLDEIGTDY
jgi:hypothetical protein